MTPKPIFKDHTGRWREQNPKKDQKFFCDAWPNKPKCSIVQECDCREFEQFEQSIQYHDFPNSPDTKPGEVVMAYLYVYSCSLIEDIDVGRCKCGYLNPEAKFCENRKQYWKLAPSPEASRGNDVRGKEEPTVEQAAEELFLDEVREECAASLEAGTPLEELYDGGKLHFFKEGAKFGANWQKQQPQSDHITDTGVSAAEALKEAESRWKPQPGKHWVRTLRNAKVESFVLGSNYQASKAQSLIADKDKEIANMIEVFKWLMGYYDFPEPPTEGRPRYYWRTHLQAKLKEIGIDIHGCQSLFQPRETDTDNLKENP